MGTADSQIVASAQLRLHFWGWGCVQRHVLSTTLGFRKNLPVAAAAAVALSACAFFTCRAGLSGAGLTDFADDVADLVASSTAAEGGQGSGLSDLFGKHKLSQRYGADLATQQQVGGGGVSRRVGYIE
jgi:hypothetical protein